MHKYTAALAFLLAGVVPGMASAAESTKFEPGFNYPSEAKVFVEFCVELNSQDDRLKKDADLKIYGPQLTDTGWQILNDPKSGKPLDSRRMKARDNEDIFKDPNQNGFGPYQNAWIIYHKKDTQFYAVAIRGTVISSAPTVLEDALLNPIKADPGVRAVGNDYIRFASYDGAAVHSGFAYGTVSLLFDPDYGLLKYLQDKTIIPSDSYVYIVGHSQGASMAAHLHSVLHYAMVDEKFGFAGTSQKGQNFHIKSYGFAQPKPGNLEYAQDFSNITFAENTGIVVNNTSDVIPRVPLTINLPNDALKNLSAMKTASALTRYQYQKLAQFNVLQSIDGFNQNIGGKLELAKQAVDDAISRLSHRNSLTNDDANYLSGIQKYVEEHSSKPSANYNYTLAGFLVPLLGHPDSQYNGQTKDEFIEHHAPTYRQLLSEKFANSVN